ncbi:MAG: 8-amino-7-oxononanoate synthase, partial [Verrucomicrobiia bacterium]
MDFSRELDHLRELNLLRRITTHSSAGLGELEIRGTRLINFGSNDYLGLSSHPDLVAQGQAALKMFGVGATASRLVVGTREPHERLERTLAEFKGAESALSFSSGYATATGVIPALVGPEDIVIADRLSHACLVDGIRLSRAVLRVFPHNHMGRLESLLSWARHQHKGAKILIVTESIFSMDGDEAPLAEIIELKERFEAFLLVDEAHGVGVTGPEGQGVAARLGLSDRVDLHMGTLSKAVGVSGGYVASSRECIQLLMNRARSFIFSTAVPPAIAEMAVAGIGLVRGPVGENAREHLRELIRLVEGRLPQRFQRSPSSS